MIRSVKICLIRFNRVPVLYARHTDFPYNKKHLQDIYDALEKDDDDGQHSLTRQ